MVQILNTGAGTFKEWQPSSFDPIEAVKEAGRMEADLAKYKYAVRKEREQEFLKSVSVDTENMIYNSLQGAMKDKLDEFTNFAVDLEKRSNGNLSLENKMQIAQKKRELEQWRDNRLNVANQLVKKKQIVYQDMSPFDFEETQRAITEEEKDILNIPSVSTPVMRYKGMYEAYNDAYKKIGATGFYTETDEEEFSDAAGNKEKWVVQRRNGIENEDKRVATFWETVGDLDSGKRGTDFELGRSIMKKWKDLKEADKQNGTNVNMEKYPTPNALAEKEYFPTWGQPRKLYKQISGKVEKQKASDFNLDTGIGGGWAINVDKGYTNKEFGVEGGSLVFRDEKGKRAGGIMVRFSGRVLDANGEVMTNIGDDEYEVLNATPDKFIVETFKGSDEEDKEATKRLIGDKAKSSLAAGLLGKIYKDEFDGKTRRVLKRADGSLYLTMPLEVTQGQIPRNEGTNNLDILEQIKGAFKFKGTALEFNQYINKRMSEIGKKTEPKQEFKSVPKGGF
jgi:hypothetical protein